MPDINADFSKRVVMRPEDQTWVPSPSAGVERIMLDRIGDEVARATSFVRFAPGSYFPHHDHGGGEEFFVLDGVFSDETGDYGRGSYIRNPIGTGHRPYTEQGCTIFVKLWQFAPNDQISVKIDTSTTPWHPGLVPGLSVMPLHEFGTEGCALVKWEPGTIFNPHTHFGGEEILVLEGIFEDEYGAYPAGTWLRNPDGSRHHPQSQGGCTIFVKTGHLLEPFPQALPA